MRPPAFAEASARLEVAEEAAVEAGVEGATMD
jgi:hypothetical protein